MMTCTNIIIGIIRIHIMIVTIIIDIMTCGIMNIPVIIVIVTYTIIMNIGTIDLLIIIVLSRLGVISFAALLEGPLSSFCSPQADSGSLWFPWGAGGSRWGN